MQLSIIGPLTDENFNQCSAILYVDENLIHEQLFLQMYSKYLNVGDQNPNNLYTNIQRSQLTPQLHPMLDTVLLLKQQIENGFFGFKQALTEQEIVDVNNMKQFSLIDENYITGTQLIHQLLLQDSDQIFQMQKQQLFYGDSPGLLLKNWIDNGKNSLNLIISVEKQFHSTKHTYILARNNQFHYCVLQCEETQGEWQTKITDKMYLSSFQYIKKYIDVDQSNPMYYLSVINVLQLQEFNDPYFDCVVKYMTKFQGYHEQQTQKDAIKEIHNFFLIQTKENSVSSLDQQIDNIVKDFLQVKLSKQQNISKFLEQMMNITQNNNIYGCNLEQLLWIMWGLVLHSDNPEQNKDNNAYRIKNILSQRIPTGHFALFGVQWNMFDFGLIQSQLLFQIFKLFYNQINNKYYHIAGTILYECKHIQLNKQVNYFDIFQEECLENILEDTIHTQNINIIQYDLNKYNIKVENIAMCYNNLSNINFEDIQFPDIILGMNDKTYHKKLQTALNTMLNKHSNVRYCGTIQILIHVQSQNKRLQLLKCQNICFIYQNIIELIKQEITQSNVSIDQINKLQIVKQFDQTFNQTIVNYIQLIQLKYRQQTFKQMMYQQISATVIISGRQLSADESLMQYLLSPLLYNSFVYHNQMLLPIKHLSNLTQQEYNDKSTQNDTNSLKNQYYQIIPYNDHCFDTTMPIIYRDSDILLYKDDYFQPLSKQDLSLLHDYINNKQLNNSKIIFISPQNGCQQNQTFFDKLVNVMQYLYVTDITKALKYSNINHDILFKLLCDQQNLKHCYTYGECINHEPIAHTTALLDLHQNYISINLVISHQLWQKMTLGNNAQLEAQINQKQPSPMYNVYKISQPSYLCALCNHILRPLERVQTSVLKYLKFPEMNWIVSDRVELSEDILTAEKIDISEADSADFPNQELAESRLQTKTKIVDKIESKVPQKVLHSSQKSGKVVTKSNEKLQKNIVSSKSKASTTSILKEKVKTNSPTRSGRDTGNYHANKATNTTVATGKHTYSSSNTRKPETATRQLESQENQINLTQSSGIFDLSLQFNDESIKQQDKYVFHILDQVSLQLETPINQIFNFVSPKFKKTYQKIQ